MFTSSTAMRMALFILFLAEPGWINNKRREIEQKREAENKKIQLEKDRMKHETELQRMSDKAAIDREKLKANTALRNKVVGESKSK